MPFDDASVRYANALDPLLAHGIVPVSPEVVKKHKEKMFAATGVHWSSYVFLTSQLAISYKLDLLTTDTEKPPRRLLKLLKEASQVVEAPQIEVEYVNDDPIVNILYGPADNRQQACLGIYFRGRTVAIAGSLNGGWSDAIATRLGQWKFNRYLRLF